MAPLCADPRQIIITLNPARRRALLQLVEDITSYMVQQLDTTSSELGPVEVESDFEDKPLENTDGKPTDISDKDTPSNAPAPERPQDAAASHESDRASASRKTKQARRVQSAALKHINGWRDEFLPKLKEIVNVEDTQKIQTERRNRVEAMEKTNLDTPEEGEHLISFGDVKVDKSADVASLQALYKPTKTRLTTIPQRDRREALSCTLLLLLSTGKYSAHSRTLAMYLASALEIPQAFLNKEETEIATSLMESSAADESQKEAMSAEAEAAKRRADNKFSRFWKVGLASVAGAAVIGVTGGLAAPIVAGALGSVLGGVGLGGVASFLGIFWMNGALVGALFGAYGASMTGKMMDRYAKEVEDFSFIPLQSPPPDEGGDDRNQPDEKRIKPSQNEQESRRLRITIGINGWLNDKEDITQPWRVMSTDTEVFALRYEMKTLLALGTVLRDLVGSVAWKAVKAEIIQRTALAALSAALWPITVISAASNLDNPFSRANNRSRKAGQLLADALINRVQGERPVTLIGYSLGATAIHACLQSLAERHAFGLVDTVVVVGAPAPSDPAHWRTLRAVVSGKIFNVYSENDMILALVYRLHSFGLGVAGLQAIKDVKGVENLDLSERVSGHLRYPSLTGEILRQCGFVGINAVAEIEKDEVMKMRGEHNEGDLIDFGDDSTSASQGQYAERERSDKAAPTADLHGLSITPSALQPPHRRPVPQQATPLQPNDNPTLPPRPQAVDDEPSPALPRRPVASAKPDEEDLERRDPPTQPPRRPLTPATNDSDDSEYRAITLVDNDSD